MQRVVEHPPELLRAPTERAPQVGAADVTDEQRVAAQHRVGVDGLLGVRHEDRDRLGRVPGRLQHGQAHRPELHRIAVGHRRERVLGPRPSAEMDRRALALAKLEVSGHEVGVEVRQEHVTDPALKPAGVLEVLLDIALRVDHSCGSARLVGDEVRGVREAAEVVLLEDHDVSGAGAGRAMRKRNPRASGTAGYLAGARRERTRANQPRLRDRSSLSSCAALVCSSVTSCAVR